ncbi:ABC transporter permease [Spirosoma fluviale]|uniref:MacB-like core domain-containing protein n=1 Tax=Spirosoma fluviale TaxID=1597977 RepID=A0A286G0N4_9BACT|nr:hypothetical protein [Spirosoma fluviale]SOD89107.1 hypothetical protein SAMN06269250_2952 [Spirosoma fluviale]
MFLNYLKIALRTLRKSRVFSLINMAGLALGIATFAFILEYVAYERSVNTFHKNLPTLYRMLTQTKEGDIWSDMAPAIGTLTKREFPEVTEFCRERKSRPDEPGKIVTIGIETGLSAVVQNLSDSGHRTYITTNNRL